MQAQREIVIIGGGGFAREVAWLAGDCGYSVIGCLADNETEITEDSVDYLGPIEHWVEYECCFVVAIGSPRVRKNVVDRMEAMGRVSWATLIHPSVRTSEYVAVGHGSVICAGVIMTTNIRVGVHAILNLSATIGHDCEIGSFATIAPLTAVSGGVKVGFGVEIGTGSCIRQNINLEDGAMIGMGSVVVNHIESNVLALGAPAKVVRSLEPFIY